MASTIKGITVEIGGDTQPLNKALKDVNKTASSLSGELRVIDKLLKLDPTNTSLLAQKQKVLAESIQNTTEKLDKLKIAQQQAQAQLERGEIGADQYRALERQVISTENKLNDLNKKAKNTEDALNEAGDAAQKSGKDMQSLSVGGVALGTVLGNIATKLLEFAGSAATFLTDAVEETKEFRSDLSKLEQNAKAAGTSIGDVSDDLEYFIAVTDESDSSVEALSNLLKAGFTGETLTDAVNNLSGAVVAFPDTLKIESLADSLQETLATGAATGQYGELLERLGVNLEEFDAGLQKCTTAAEKQQYAIDILAKNGMAELNAQYQEANADLIAYSKAQTRYTETLSKVGTAMQPVMTAFTEIKTSLLEGMVPALETAGEALTQKLANSETQAAFKKMGDGLANVASAFANFAVFVIENGEMIVKIIGSIAAGFVAWKISSIIQSLGGLQAAFQAIIPAIKNMGKAITSISSSTIIGAIVTVATLVATIAESFLGASDATEDFKDEMKSLKDEAEGMGTEFAATQEKLAISGDTMRSLVGDIQELDSSIKSGNLSAGNLAAAQGQLAAKTAEYNAAAGEEVLKINDATGAIDGSTSALAKNTEALIENAKKAADVEALQKAFEAQTEAQAQQAAQLAEIDKYYDQLSDEQKKYVDQMKEEGVNVEALSNLWYSSPIWGGQVNNEIRGIVEGLEDSIDAEKAAGEQVGYLSEAVEKGAQSGEQYATSTKKQTEAIAELTEQEAVAFMQRIANGETLTQADQDALTSWKENNAERAADLEAAVEREKELYQQRVDAATDANNAIDLSNQTSLEKATENIEHNTQVVEEYTNNMDYLYGKIPDIVYQYLEEAGTDQARLVSEMKTDMETGGGEIAQRFIDAYIAALNAGKSPSEAAAYAIGQGTDTGVGTGINDAQNATNAASEEMTGIVDTMKSAVNDEGNFVYVGRGIIQQMSVGMRQMANKLYDVADNIVSNLKSKFNINVSVSGTAKGANLRGFATGGVVWNEEIVRVAENGPEAIIPLDRLGGIIQGIINNNGGRTGGNTYQLNVYTSDLSDGAQARLFKNFSKWAGRRLN